MPSQVIFKILWHFPALFWKAIEYGTLMIMIVLYYISLHSPRIRYLLTNKIPSYYYRLDLNFSCGLIDWKLYKVWNQENDLSTILYGKWLIIMCRIIGDLVPYELSFISIETICYFTYWWVFNFYSNAVPFMRTSVCNCLCQTWSKHQLHWPLLSSWLTRLRIK